MLLDFVSLECAWWLPSRGGSLFWNSYAWSEDQKITCDMCGAYYLPSNATYRISMRGIIKYLCSEACYRKLFPLPTYEIYNCSWFDSRGHKITFEESCEIERNAFQGIKI